LADRTEDRILAWFIRHPAVGEGAHARLSPIQPGSTEMIEDFAPEQIANRCRLQ
jgi:hypothetical protein